MKNYIMNVRKNLNKMVKNYCNKVYSGAGDTLTSEVGIFTDKKTTSFSEYDLIGDVVFVPTIKNQYVNANFKPQKEINYTFLGAEACLSPEISKQIKERNDILGI